MAKIKSFSLVCFTFALQACGTMPQRSDAAPKGYVLVDEIKIQSKFKTIEISKDTMELELRKCIPTLGEIKGEYRKHVLDNFPSTSVISTSDSGSANRFWRFNNQSICIQTSSNKYPIFAAEMFIGTVSPNGVPQEIVDSWYKQIALLIAKKGSANVAYVYENGDASIANYRVQDRNLSVDFSHILKKAGSWEGGIWDLRFSHPEMTYITEPKLTYIPRKFNLLEHRQPHLK